MIVVCGEALIDMVPVALGDSDAYVARPGGSPHNVAVGLGRLGSEVAFLGRLSGDRFGRRLRHHLVAEHVDLRYLATGPERTTLAFVGYQAGADAEYNFYADNSADRNLVPADLPSELDEGVTALHFGSLSLALEPSASTLSAFMELQHGRRFVSLDPNVRPELIADRDGYRGRLMRWLELVDLVKVSVADLSWLYPGRPVEDVASDWQARCGALVIATRGADGAVAFGPNVAARQAAIPVEVVDTVGAGDAFTAGTLAWLQRHSLLDRVAFRSISAPQLGEMLLSAATVAALTCTRAGAEPPSLDELEVASARMRSNHGPGDRRSVKDQ